MRHGHFGEGDQVVLGLLDAQQALGDGDLPAHLIGGGRRIRLLLRGSLGSHYCWPRRCLMPAQVAAKMPLTRPVTRATVIAIVTFVSPRLRPRSHAKSACVSRMSRGLPAAMTTDIGRATV